MHKPEHTPEQVSSIAYDDYIHELPERYMAAPIMKHVELLQKHYAQESWGESQLQGVWHSAQGLLGEFRTQAQEQGLIHQLVVLEGDGIKIPQMSVDLRSGHYMVTHEDVPGLRNDTFARYQATHEVMGFFAGYSLAFAETAPNSKRYKAQLIYQVSTGMTVPTPHGPVPLYTTGVVGESNLRFMEDERRDIIAESANRLYELIPNERGSIHRVVETALTKHHEDDSLFRHLGYHAEKIVADASDEQRCEAEDILVKLIASTFVEQQDVELLTDEHIRQFDDKALDREYYCGSSEDEMSLVNGEVRGVIFLNDTRGDGGGAGSVAGGSAVKEGRARLNMVIGRPSEVVFVPMTNIFDYVRRVRNLI